MSAYTPNGKLTGALLVWARTVLPRPIYGTTPSSNSATSTGRRRLATPEILAELGIWDHLQAQKENGLDAWGWVDALANGGDE